MSDDVSKGMEAAYDEASNFVDYQLKVTDQLDKELLTLMKFTILLTGSIYPLFNIIIQPNNDITVTQFQPWLILTVIVLLYSTWYSTQSFRNGIYYGGYEGSPFFDFHSITGQKPVKKPLHDFSNIDFPNNKEFYLKLLNDYSIGIAHNNWEIRFKSKLVHHVFKLITLSTAVFVIGVIINISPHSGPFGGGNIHTIAYIIVVIFSSYEIIKSYQMYKDYTDREDVDERLTAADYK
jgi:hypothetical protein